MDGRMTAWELLFPLLALLGLLLLWRFRDRLLGGVAARRPQSEEAPQRFHLPPRLQPSGEPAPAGLAPRGMPAASPQRPAERLPPPAPPRGTRRRLRALLAEPAGRRAAVLAAELLGPPLGGRGTSI